MAQAAKSVRPPSGDPDSPARSRPRLDMDAAPAGSPARQLQDQLAAAWVMGAEPDVARWSPRRAAAFAVGASLGLWGLIGATAWAVLH
jgi:hypothetical protein